ncbi:hypothetical protein Vafri_4498 [Volvox africanus]|nr:hypothetical protein Vafri_4498 [Volvox africanus]
MAAVPAMVVHLGITAVVEASQGPLGRVPKMVTARNSACRLIASADYLMRAQEGTAGGRDFQVSLWRNGMTLRDTFLHCAKLDWQQLDETLDRSPLPLRSFAFAEACGEAAFPELCNVLARLRPKLTLIHPNTWGHLVEAARSDPQSKTVLDFAVKGVVLLIESRVTDEQLHPVFCAELCLLILLLRLEPAQLESLRKRPSRATLASYAAALGHVVRDACLIDKPYRYLSPGQLYDVLCTSALGDGPADRDISSSSETVSWVDHRQHSKEYVHTRLVAILELLEPAKFVVALTEAALVNAVFAAGPHYESSPDVQDALNDLLAAQVVLSTAREIAVRAEEPSRVSPGGASAAFVGLPDAPAAAVGSVDTMGALRSSGASSGAVDTELPAAGFITRGVLDAQGGPQVESTEGPAEGLRADAHPKPDAVAAAASAGDDAEAASAAPTDDGTALERPLGPYDALREMVRKNCELAATIISSSGGSELCGINETDARRFASIYVPMRTAYEFLTWMRSTNMLGEDLSEDTEALAALDDLLLRSGQVACHQPANGGVRESHLEQRPDAVFRAAAAFTDTLMVDLADCLKYSELKGLQNGLPVRVLVETLRPGLLAAHSDTWGALIRFAEAEMRNPNTAGTRGDGRYAAVAFNIVDAAVRGLVSLAGQDMPVQVIGLSSCALAGVIFRIQLDHFEKEYTAQEDTEHRIKCASMIASLAFRWLRFTPLIQVLNAKSGRSAVAVAAAAAPPLPIPPSQESAVLPRSYNRSGPQLLSSSLECVVASMGMFSAASSVPRVVVLLSAYMTDWMLERWQRKGWRPSGRGKLWPRRVYESEGRLTEEHNKQRVARHLVAVLCDVPDVHNDGGARDVVQDGGHKREQHCHNAREKINKLDLEEERGDAGSGLGRPDQVEGAQELYPVNEHRGADATEDVVPEFIVVGDGAVRVTTKVVKKTAIPTAALTADTRSSRDAFAQTPSACISCARTNSCTCSSSSTTGSISRQSADSSGHAAPIVTVSSDNTRITGAAGGQIPGTATSVVSELSFTRSEGAATSAARGSGPVVFRTGCGVTDLIKVLAMWSRVMDAIAHRAWDVRYDLVLEGCEALAMFMMIIAECKGLDQEVVISLRPCCGGEIEGCATTHLSPQSNERKAVGRDPPPALEPLQLLLMPGHNARVAYSRTHGSGEASRGPHFVTVTAFSKVLQQVKVVRKALRDDNSGVFEVRAQGFEGLRRALQLVLQICSDMRAAKRDVIVQPTDISLHQQDSEDLANRQGASSGRQQPQPRRHERTAGLTRFLDTLMGVVDDMMHVHGMFFCMGDTSYCASGETIATLGQAEKDLRWLWHQVRDRGSTDNVSDGDGGVREALYVTMLLAECAPGRPTKLVIPRTEGSARSHPGGRKHLQKVMLSSM